jgi:hypothetical protein
MTEHYPTDLMFTAAYVIRRFNHDSRPEQLAESCLAASDVHRTTESAVQLALGMRQALTHLASSLHRPPTAFDVYTPNPESIAVAVGALADAAEAFTVAAQHLRDAHAVLVEHNANEGGAQT